MDRRPVTDGWEKKQRYGRSLNGEPELRIIHATPAIIHNSNKKGFFMETRFKKLFDALNQAILTAEKKHLFFPSDPQKAIAIITEEYLELIREINDRAEDGGNSDRIYEESMDMLVTLSRLVMKLQKEVGR